MHLFLFSFAAFMCVTSFFNLIGGELEAELSDNFSDHNWLISL